MTRFHILPGNFSDNAIERWNVDKAIHKHRVSLVSRDIAAQHRAALVVIIGRATVFGLVVGLVVAFFA